MLGQETRDLGAMIVQQGYKSSFMILYGHSRLDRPNENLIEVNCSYQPVFVSLDRLLQLCCLNFEDYRL